MQFWALKFGYMDENVIFLHDTGSFPVQYVQTATTMNYEVTPDSMQI